MVNRVVNISLNYKSLNEDDFVDFNHQQHKTWTSFTLKTKVSSYFKELSLDILFNEEIISFRNLVFFSTYPYF